MVTDKTAVVGVSTSLKLNRTSDVVLVEALHIEVGVEIPSETHIGILTRSSRSKT